MLRHVKIILPGVISGRIIMERDDIKKWQAKKIAESLHPGLNYLFRLLHRMEKAGFRPDDSYYKLVSDAYNAVHKLWVHTHYMSGPEERAATMNQIREAV
jgi:hypothetical protein